MAGKATAIDVGGHSIRVMQVRAGRKGLQVQRFSAAPAGEGAGALGDLPLKSAVCGLGGRDMTLRYSQVPPTPDWQLRNLMNLEIQDLAQQSGGSLSADYNLLAAQDPEAGVDTVLLALARDEALDKLQEKVREAGGAATGFSPNCIALYNAWLRGGAVEPDAVVCLANLGHETIDIALVKGADLLFARNLSGGGKVLDDAIAAAFNVSARKAESLKRDLLDLDPQSRGRYASGQAEKVTVAAGGAANAIVAGIQSSLAFAKSQTKIADLRLDKVLICGGSARLRGLRGMLREALRCPVEPFDPFAAVDLSALPPDEADQLQAMRLEAVVAFGLAAGRADETLYSLEIVPAEVRRRKKFYQQTLSNIAAAAVAALLLLLTAKQARADLEAAEGVLFRVRGQVGAAKAVHDDTERIVAQNRRDRALVDHLATLAAPLHGSLRTLRAVRENLPPQLWLKKIDVSQKSGVQGGRRPVVVIDGAGKEIDGADAGQVLLRFSNDFRASPWIPRDRVTFSSPSTAEAAVQFQITIDWTPTEGGTN